jgi:dTMP kinase
MFITFEGGDGAGKTTQAVRLVDRLNATNHRAHFTREPGGTPLAWGIRALLLNPEESLEALWRFGLVSTHEPVEETLPLTELLLLTAARTQHVERIRAWLDSGLIVVCDRFADATRAYQGAARGLSQEVVGFLEEQATGGLKPDLTFLFDLPVEQGQKRKQRSLRRSFVQMNLFETRPWNRLDRESIGFHERVRQGYLEVAKAEPERWVILDATQPIDKLASEVWEVVSSRLPLPPDSLAPSDS